MAYDRTDTDIMLVVFNSNVPSTISNYQCVYWMSIDLTFNLCSVVYTIHNIVLVKLFIKHLYFIFSVHVGWPDFLPPHPIWKDFPLYQQQVWFKILIFAAPEFSERQFSLKYLVSQINYSLEQLGWLRSAVVVTLEMERKVSSCSSRLAALFCIIFSPQGDPPQVLQTCNPWTIQPTWPGAATRCLAGPRE